MRTLTIMVIVCTLLSVGCSSDYDAGIEAYKRGHYEAALHEFKKRANQDDPVAQFCLGYMYKHDKTGIIKRDDEKAKEYYKKAAEQDYAPAQNNLAVMYFREAERAEARIRRANDRILLDEAVKMEVKKEENKIRDSEMTRKKSASRNALKWFQKAGKRNDGRIAQYNIALLHYSDAKDFEGYAEDEEEWVELLKRADEYFSELPEGEDKARGLETSESTREVIRRAPTNAKKSYEQAIVWFKKAAGEDKNATDNGGKNAIDRSYAPAQFYLGNMYYDGEGEEKNLAEAKKWYEKAAKKGDAPAQFNLGNMYYNGEGVEKNLTEAKKWYEKAAKKGDARAQFNLGKMYYDGKGVGKDLTKAVKWYTRATRQKHAAAQNNLAIMYDKGEGTKQNSEVATRYYFEAAQQGNVIAQSNVGNLFKEGLDGIPQDNEEAYYWYSLALANKAGLENAVNANLVNEVNDRLEAVGNRLTEPEKHKIQERVDKWKPKTFEWVGTGFYVSKDHVLTNAHVARWPKEPDKEWDEIRINFRFVKEKPDSVDWDVDLALLVDPSKEMDSFAKFRDNRVKVGEMIALFGYPKSDRLSYSGNGTSGQVSGLAGGKHDVTRPDYELFSQNLFQHTAPQQGGNSGGPVFDLAGNVVGVAVSGWNRVDIENVSFAIKSNVVTEFLRKNGIQPAPGDLRKRKDYLTDIYENIYEKAQKFTVPVWCYSNKGAAPFPVVEITINELKK